MVEASYVGNRGVWWPADSLKDINALTLGRIASFGLDINNAADRTLLASRLDSPVAAQRGFNKVPYVGFPLSLTVAQSLRPFPQFATINSVFTTLGNTWYDSLQAKATKRYSYGLDFTTTFTWQKELTLGVEGSDTGGAAAVNDVFNRQQNKQLSSFSRPLVLGIAANYQLPRLSTNRLLSPVIRNWRFGTVLQYASGRPIRVPYAQNALNSLLLRNRTGAQTATFANRIPGQPLFTKDLNCRCFDPSTEFVLNPAAWADPLPGQFGTSAAYYNDFRQQRRPVESVSLSRSFFITERVKLQVRVDFSNPFNRTYLNDPDATNAKATQTANPQTGQLISGFGRINTGSSVTSFFAPRQGTMIVRLEF
jgi:hypothetical protein